MPAGEQEAAAEVIAAYEHVIVKWPGSDIAAYCGIRLAGFHQFRGDYAKASAVASEVAAAFRGTVHEMDAYFTIGLMHLQALHDPAAAIPWLKKVPTPPGADEKGVVPRDKYDEAHCLYFSVQKQLAICEAMLGHVAEAKERQERLARRYPQHASHVHNSGKADLLYAQQYRDQPRPASGGRDPVQPDRLVTPVLDERTALETILGPDRTPTKAAPPPSPRTSPAEPPAAPPQAHLPVTPAASAPTPIEAREDEGQRRVFRALGIASACLAAICGCAILYIFGSRSRRKETRQ